MSGGLIRDSWGRLSYFFILSKMRAENRRVLGSCLRRLEFECLENRVLLAIDLAVDPLELPSSVSVGGRLAFDFTVRNLGDETGQSQNRVYFSEDSTPDAGELIATNQLQVEPGNLATWSGFELEIPSSTGLGRYFVIIVAHEEVGVDSDPSIDTATASVFVYRSTSRLRYLVRRALSATFFVLIVADHLAG